MQADGTVYKAMVTAPYVGQIRERQWNMIGELGDEGMVEIWSKRVMQYWAAHCAIFGLELEPVDPMYVLDVEPTILRSKVRISGVLPGKRLPQLPRAEIERRYEAAGQVFKQ